MDHQLWRFHSDIYYSDIYKLRLYHNTFLKEIVHIFIYFLKKDIGTLVQMHYLNLLGLLLPKTAVPSCFSTLLSI